MIGTPSIAILFTPHVLIGVACLLFWYFSTYKYGFWKRQKIKFKRPVPFFGNIGKFALLRQPFHECMHELYVYFKDEPFGGFFQMRDPVLLIRDPDLVHKILIEDFKHFNDHGFEFINPDRELNPLSLHLFASKGDDWRGLRRKISPIFSTAKLKSMEDQMLDCVKKLNSFLETEVKQSAGDIELKSIFERLTIDVIGSCAFGIECNSLKKNDEFTEHGRVVFTPNLLQMSRVLIGVFSKRLLKKLRIPDLPESTKTFFLNLVLDTMKHRRRHHVNRPDILQLLMGLQNSYESPGNAPEGCKKDPTMDKEDVFDELHIAANSFLFFAAGFETTASTLSYCLYELAVNKNIQDRLRQELENAYNEHNQCLSVEYLNDVSYLDAVISETLRKYPPLPWLIRKAEDDWIIPNSDNKVLPKGTNIIIPTWSIQHDWQYYPNPEVFDPERFLGDNAAEIRNGTYVPFGDGPRKCLGDRFARMEIKLALSDFLLKYSVSPCSRTKIPLDYVQGAVMLTSKGGTWVNVSERKV